jgi:nucleoid-associated protein YgaU
MEPTVTDGTDNELGGMMGIFDFLKDKGEDVLTKATGTSEKESDARKAGELQMYVTRLKLPVKDLVVDFDGGTATVYGKAASQADREKAVLAVGNAKGVARVDDRITVEKSEPAATFYTVKSGDTLSGIAKEHYGDASRYPAIFDANKPMLTDPDRIYPGQVLRIPAKQT